MQISTPILAFVSGADMMIISVILLIPVALVLALVVTAIARRKQNQSVQQTQTMLLNGILEELKKLNTKS